MRRLRAGLGCSLRLSGLTKAHIVVADPETFVRLGNVKDPSTALALLGLGLMVALEIWRVKGSILIGVMVVTAAAWGLGLMHWTPASGGFQSLTATAFKLDIPGAVHVGLLEIVFVFFFVDLFDNLGTLVAVTKRAGLLAQDHTIPRLNRILFADAIATVAGSLTGTSTVTSYVESTAGVAAGGRSGITAIVTGLLFLVAMVAAPFIGVVPDAATAPALILVGSLMLTTVTEIRWTEPLVAVPAFLTLILIPLTYSIANGLGFGIIAWAVLAHCRRQADEEGLAALPARGAFSAAVYLPFCELKGELQVRRLVPDGLRPRQERLKAVNLLERAEAELRTLRS